MRIAAASPDLLFDCVRRGSGVAGPGRHPGSPGRGAHPHRHGARVHPRRGRGVCGPRGVRLDRRGPGARGDPPGGEGVRDPGWGRDHVPVCRVTPRALVRRGESMVQFSPAARGRGRILPALPGTPMACTRGEERRAAGDAGSSPPVSVQRKGACRMGAYEIVAVLRPDLDEEGLGAALDRITQRIVEHGGATTALERWGKRKLAYPIKKHRDGYYALFVFTLATDRIGPHAPILGLPEALRPSPAS